MTRRDDQGAAAIEFALLLPLMVCMALFLYPIGQAYYDKIRLGRAAGDAIRFATSAPNSPEIGSTGRRPTADEIASEAVRAYTAAGGSGLSNGDVTVNASSTPGQPVTLTITKTDDLGAFGSVLSFLNIHSTRLTVTVSASGREE